ncbi:MAG: hypothetical protein EOM34_00515 [Clostridia bacterium]|jgi:hypothetical protein|nr:hypothetical protein [Lachnospiraceae bacterium]NCB99147.1 hypothetical protein [Clostridia bacterium]NCD02244.1 hypothetical protein [Clostridia bacterium]
MIGLLCIGTGILGIVIRVITKSVNKNDSLASTFGYALIAMGLFMCFEYYILKSERLMARTFFLCMGVPFVVYAFYNFVNLFRCSTKILAQYEGFDTMYSPRMPSTYYPKFSYRVDGMDYHEKSAKNESLELLEADMEIGRGYEIYIVPGKPETFILTKKIKFLNIFFLIVGAFFAAFGLLIPLQ